MEECTEADIKIFLKTDFTNYKILEREIKKIITFTFVSKRIKYLGIKRRRQKTCTPKTIKHWWNKLKMTQTDGKIYHVLRLEESILLKWLYYPRWSTDSMKSLSNYQWRFKIHMETQRNSNSQNTLEKEEQRWTNQAPWLQTILQSYSHQNNMVLSQKQTHRSMEQDRKPRNKLRCLWSINLWERGKNMHWR